MAVPRFDAIVLAGGAGSRLGGLDKGAVRIGGRSLLSRVLAACATAATTIVVGPAQPVPSDVRSTREDPPGGGPVAGLAAGLRLVTAPLVVVLACDLPFLAPETVEGLVDRLTTDGGAVDGAQLVDEAGRPQPLAAVYWSEPLRAALRAVGPPAGAPVRRVLGRLTMLDVDTEAGQAWDCDTWSDVRRAEAWESDHKREEP